MVNMQAGDGHPLEVALITRAAAVARRGLRVEELLREPQTIAVVRGVDEWGVSLLAAVLVDEFRRQAPRRGELVTVRYGARQWSAGTLPGKYRLLVERE
jgi:hypothetical protein